MINERCLFMNSEGKKIYAKKRSEIFLMVCLELLLYFFLFTLFKFWLFVSVLCAYNIVRLSPINRNDERTIMVYNKQKGRWKKVGGWMNEKKKNFLNMLNHRCHFYLFFIIIIIIIIIIISVYCLIYTIAFLLHYTSPYLQDVSSTYISCNRSSSSPGTNLL